MNWVSRHGLSGSVSNNLAKCYPMMQEQDVKTQAKAGGHSSHTDITSFHTTVGELLFGYIDKAVFRW